MNLEFLNTLLLNFLIRFCYLQSHEVTQVELARAVLPNLKDHSSLLGEHQV
jgi:hypothetical protein